MFGRLLRFVVLWTAVSPLLIALIVQFAFDTRYVFALKDVPVYLALLVAIVSRFRATGALYLAACGLFVTYVGTNFLALNPGYDAPLESIRQLISPLLIVAIGLFARLSESEARRFAAFVYRVLVLSVIVGVVFLAVDIWAYIPLNTYFSLKGIPTDASGHSYMFYEPAFNYMRRMVGTFLDPISFGHTLAAGAIAAFYGLGLRGARRWVVFSILLLGTMLTISKGAMLELFVALALLNRRVHPVLKVLSVSVPIVAVMLLPDHSGLLIHINGLTRSIEKAQLFGYGLGNAGNYAKMFGSDLSVYYDLGVSDTFLGSVLAQLGVFGLVAWLAFFLPFVSRPSRSQPSDVGAIIVASTLLVAIMSENTMNLTSFAIPGLLASVITSQVRAERRRRRLARAADAVAEADEAGSDDVEEGTEYPTQLPEEEEGRAPDQMPNDLHPVSAVLPPHIVRS